MKVMSNFVTIILAFTHEYRNSGRNQTHIIWLCTNQQANDIDCLQFCKGWLCGGLSGGLNKKTKTAQYRKQPISPKDCPESGHHYSKNPPKRRVLLFGNNPRHQIASLTLASVYRHVVSLISRAATGTQLNGILIISPAPSDYRSLPNLYTPTFLKKYLRKLQSLIFLLTRSPPQNYVRFIFMRNKNEFSSVKSVMLINKAGSERSNKIKYQQTCYLMLNLLNTHSNMTK